MEEIRRSSIALISRTGQLLLLDCYGHGQPGWRLTSSFEPPAGIGCARGCRTTRMIQSSHAYCRYQWLDELCAMLPSGPTDCEWLTLREEVDRKSRRVLFRSRV